MAGFDAVAAVMRLRLSADRIALIIVIAALLFLATDLQILNSDLRALIRSECSLFYGPSGANAVQECVTEMSRRRSLPTHDESVLAQPPFRGAGEVVGR